MGFWFSLFIGRNMLPIVYADDSQAIFGSTHLVPLKTHTQIQIRKNDTFFRRIFRCWSWCRYNFALQRRWRRSEMRNWCHESKRSSSFVLTRVFDDDAIKSCQHTEWHSFILTVNSSGRHTCSAAYRSQYVAAHLTCIRSVTTALCENNQNIYPRFVNNPIDIMRHRLSIAGTVVTGFFFTFLGFMAKLLWRGTKIKHSHEWYGKARGHRENCSKENMKSEKSVPSICCATFEFRIHTKLAAKKMKEQSFGMPWLVSHADNDISFIAVVLHT